MNRRDQQIAAINANIEGLREDRLVTCREQILESYAEASAIDKLAHMVELTDREPSDFHVLTNSEARPMAHFNGDTYDWEFYCKELARSIALREERYLLEQLANLSGDAPPIDASRPTFQPLLDGIAKLRDSNSPPTVIVAPISLYLPVFEKLTIDLQDGRTVVLPDGYKLELFWSSRAAPIDRFVVLDRSAGDWRVKLDPVSGGRLTVAIGRPESPPGAVTFLAETVVRYEVTKRERMFVIEVVGQPPDDFGLEQTKSE